MPPTTPVITTKLLLPSRRGGLLHRPRLVDFLFGNIDHKLVVVSAPAGYGKTTVLVDLAHQMDAPVCWYALDQYDADPRVFLNHLIACIQQRMPAFGRRTQTALDNTVDVEAAVHSLAAVMANEIYEVGDFVVVVLDDFHNLESSEPINEFLSLLLRYTDDSFHLILASRTLPAIPDQALMAARGQMIGLSQEELRFTPDEIQEMVRQNFDLSMPHERAQELASHCDGWITGILLTGHQATWKGLVQGVVNLGEASGRVYDYLAEQVLSFQAADMRHFMLHVSVLDSMTAADCNELLSRSDSGVMLERMAHSNVFISQAGDRVYTFHHLFRDFLRHRLQTSETPRYRELRVRSARLYAGHGDWQRAVAVYLEIGMHHEAADTLERTGRILLDARKWDSLIQWLDALPAATLYARPRLLALRATLYAERGQLEAAHRLFELALDAFRLQGQVADEVETLWRMALAIHRKGRYEDALELVTPALTLLQSMPESPQRETLRGRLLDCQGLCHYRMANLTEAIDSLTRAVEQFAKVREIEGAAGTCHNLGIAYRAAGRIEDAVSFYRKALGYWAQLGNPGWLANTLNSLGLVYCLQGEWDEAESIFASALETAGQSGLLRLQSVILASQADLQRDRGDGAAALALFEQSITLSEQVRDVYFVAYSLCGQGEALRQMHELQKAEDLLVRAASRAREMGSAYLGGLCALRRGAVAIDRADYPQAGEELATARDAMLTGGFTHELAQCELQLAILAYLTKQPEAALGHLQQVDALAGQLGYDAFIAVDARQMSGLLRLAVKRLPEARRFEIALQKLDLSRPRFVEPRNEPAAAAIVPLRIYGFGRGRVLLGEEELLSQREQVKELFFFLLARHPQPVRKEEVIDHFWPDWPLQKADGSLRVTLYRLRRGICPVTNESGWLSLDLPHGVWYDVWEFRRLLLEAEALRHDPAQQADCIQRAIDLYSGDFMEQISALWVAAEREKLALEQQSAQLALARLRNRQGRQAQAIDLYRQVLRRQPYHEQAWQGLMSAQAESGNRAAAMESFRQLRNLLRDDLGVDPSPETQSAYRHILELAQ